MRRRQESSDLMLVVRMSISSFVFLGIDPHVLKPVVL
jgi:hypothetical protein